MFYFLPVSGTAGKAEGFRHSSGCTAAMLQDCQ
jgi:hypothetical protein